MLTKLKGWWQCVIREDHDWVYTDYDYPDGTHITHRKCSRCGIADMQGSDGKWYDDF